jgi:hypothetical protein
VDSIVLEDGFKKNFKFHYLYILSYIRNYRFKDRRFERDDYIPMNIDFLRNLVNYRNAVSFVKVLLESGLIETDNEYKTGKKSRGYRLSKKCYNDKFYLVENKDKLLEDRIKNCYLKIKQGVLERQDAYSYVTYCMESIEIDKKTAFKYISDADLTEYKKDSYETATELFDDKFAVVDSTSSRLHNNLTNLYTPLRKFLTYKGEQLIQCDIRNSQLVFMYLMLQKYNVPKEELDFFGKVVCEIGFYEFFAEKLGEELNEENRKEFKTFIFKDILFGTNKLKLNKIEIIFKEIFPFIFYVMRKLKMDDHKQLAILLQQAESEFIFKCIDKIGKDIPLITIHDSIGTTVGNEHIIKDVIDEQFLNIFGIKPKIKLEKFA